MGNDVKTLTEEVTRIKEMMGIQEKKADRCLRIARRKYDKPSAYRSGAIVRCRQGKIWKDLKEAGELEEFQLNEDDKLIAMAHDALTRKKGRPEYAPDVHELQAWIDEYLKNDNINESNERFQNTALDNLSAIGDFNKLRDIDKLALLGGTNDNRLLDLSLSNIFRENGGTFGQFEIKVKVKDLKDQKIKHKFSQDMAGAEGYLFPYINYSSEREPYVTVRFDQFQDNDKNFGGGNYLQLPIMMDNLYPIDYDEIKSDFVKYQDRVDFERKEFRDFFDVDGDEIDEGKTDYSKEKKSGLHGWFSRRGGDGNKGWVDCNTCRKVDGRKKCKACGRQKGEKRSKYPSCRPTPASCGTPGKGKKWGKTKNESINEVSEKPVKRVALLFIVVDNKVLLFKRSGKETTNPSKYGMLGGGIEKGESPHNALKREIKEEAGVTLTSFKPLKKYKHDGVELNVFYTNSFPMDKIELDKREHTSHKLFTLEDVMNMTDKEMIQSNKKIARDYNKKVGKKKQLEENVKEIYDILKMLGEDVIKEDTFLGHHVWKHILDITPDQDDVPWGFKKKIIQSDFNVDNNFNLESLLETDPDFREYYESGDERYNDWDDIDESDIYHDIVVVDGELLDGYSRAATLLRRGETNTSAFVGTHKG